MADCRKCVYFIPVEEMDERLKEQALIWIAKNRPGSYLLGWCKYYNRPITYFTGRCKAFKRKEPPKPRSLTEFLQGEG